MAKSRTRINRDNPVDDLEVAPPAEDNAPAPSARASTTPPKKPAAVSAVQEVPDRTPQITVQHFVRGTKDPILLAFAHHEKLAPGMRKLTRAQWVEELEAFRGASR